MPRLIEKSISCYTLITVITTLIVPLWLGLCFLDSLSAHKEDPWFLRESVVLFVFSTFWVTPLLVVVGFTRSLFFNIDVQERRVASSGFNADVSMISYAVCGIVWLLALLLLISRPD